MFDPRFNIMCRGIPFKICACLYFWMLGIQEAHSCLRSGSYGFCPVRSHWLLRLFFNLWGCNAVWQVSQLFEQSLQTLWAPTLHSDWSLITEVEPLLGEDTVTAALWPWPCAGVSLHFDNFKLVLTLTQLPSEMSR